MKNEDIIEEFVGIKETQQKMLELIVALMKKEKEIIFKDPTYEFLMGDWISFEPRSHRWVKYDKSRVFESVDTVGIPIPRPNENMNKEYKMDYIDPSENKFQLIETSFFTNPFILIQKAYGQNQKMWYFGNYQLKKIFP